MYLALSKPLFLTSLICLPLIYSFSTLSYLSIVLTKICLFSLSVGLMIRGVVSIHSLFENILFLLINELGCSSSLSLIIVTYPS